MIMEKQSIGDLIFYRNPNNMTVPESSKIATSVPTYTGSALFQWEAVLSGTEVVLEWEWMSFTEFDAIRTMFLSTSVYVWVSRYNLLSFNVVIVGLTGTLVENALSNVAYRKNIVCTLNIRSQV